MLVKACYFHLPLGAFICVRILSLVHSSLVHSSLVHWYVCIGQWGGGGGGEFVGM